MKYELLYNMHIKTVVKWKTNWKKNALMCLKKWYWALIDSAAKKYYFQNFWPISYAQQHADIGILEIMKITDAQNGSNKSASEH